MNANMEAVARLRSVTYWLNELSSLNDAYKLGRRDRDELKGLVQQFEEDWPQIAHAQRLAAAKHPRHCAAFAIRGESVLTHLANGYERRQWFESALAAYDNFLETDSDYGLLAGASKQQVLYGLGCAMADAVKTDEALRFLKAALKEKPKPGRPRQDAFYGTARIVRSKPEEAGRVFSPWHIETTLDGGPVEQGRLGRNNSAILNDIGLAHFRRKANWTCLVWLLGSLIETRIAKDRRMEAIALGNVAMVLGELSDSDAALRLHFQSIGLARQNQDWNLEANQLGDVGAILNDFGIYPVAAYYLGRAREIHEAHGSHVGVATSLGELAITQTRDGDISSGVEGFSEAVRSLQRAGYEERTKLFAQYAEMLHNLGPKGSFEFHSIERTARRASRISRMRVIVKRVAGPVVVSIVSVYFFSLSHRAPTVRVFLCGLLGCVVTQFLAIRTIEKWLQVLLLRVANGRARPNKERIFRWCFKAFPDRPRIIHAYASWLDWTGHNKEAVELLSRCARHVATDFGLSSQIAWALTDAGTDLAEATQWVEHAKRMDPDNPCLYDTEAWIDFKLQNLDTAWEKLQEAIPLADQSPDIAYHAGAILASKGEDVKALDFLNKALRSPRPFSGRHEAETLHRNLSRTR